jgi:hypothetical protein
VLTRTQIYREVRQITGWSPSVLQQKMNLIDPQRPLSPRTRWEADWLYRVSDVLDEGSRAAIGDGSFPLVGAYQLTRLPVSDRPTLIEAVRSGAVPPRLWRIQKAVSRMLTVNKGADDDDDDEDAGEGDEPIDGSQLVDTSDVLRIGSGSGTVYAWCHSYYHGVNRPALKIGRTDGTAEERIAKQIGTWGLHGYIELPDRPGDRCGVRVRRRGRRRPG